MIHSFSKKVRMVFAHLLVRWMRFGTTEILTFPRYTYYFRSVDLIFPDRVRLVLYLRETDTHCPSTSTEKEIRIVTPDSGFDL